MFSSVILIGPSTNLFPLVNKFSNITNIPVINEELLLLNLRFLQPISKIIYIIILKQDVDYISNICKLIDIPIKIIGIDFYDGSVQQLVNLEKIITTEYLIVTKGDLITNIDILTISREFLEEKNSFLTVLSAGYNEAICGIVNDKLIYYNRNENYVISNDILFDYKITVTKESDTVHFFMFKKDVLHFATQKMFSFKKNFFSFIVEKLRHFSPVKIFNPMDNYIYQLRDIPSYKNITKLLKMKIHTTCNTLIYSNDMYNQMKQFIKKNKLKDSKNITGPNLFIESGFIVDSVIGNNVKIHSNTKVLSSILMNNIIIGNNCHIEECVIGSDVIIPDNTTLIECSVSPSYVFTESCNKKMRIFANNV